MNQIQKNIYLIILSCALDITSCDSQKPNDTTQPNLTKEKEELLQKVYKINFELHGGKPPAENAIGSEEAIQNGSGADESQYHEIQLQPNKGENFVKMPADRMPKIPVHPDDQTRFDGWFTDAEYTQPFDIKKNITENITLHAKWRKVNIIHLLEFYPQDPDCVSTTDVPCAPHPNATGKKPSDNRRPTFYTQQPYLPMANGHPYTNVFPDSILSTEYVAQLENSEGMDFKGKWMTGPDCQTEFDFSKPVYDGLKIYECKFPILKFYFHSFYYYYDADAGKKKAKYPYVHINGEKVKFHLSNKDKIKNLQQTFDGEGPVTDIAPPTTPVFDESEGKVFKGWYVFKKSEYKTFFKNYKEGTLKVEDWSNYPKLTPTTEITRDTKFIFGRFDDK